MCGSRNPVYDVPNRDLAPDGKRVVALTPLESRAERRWSSGGAPARGDGPERDVHATASTSSARAGEAMRQRLRPWRASASESRPRERG